MLAVRTFVRTSVDPALGINYQCNFSSVDLKYLIFQNEFRLKFLIKIFDGVIKIVKNDNRGVSDVLEYLDWECFSCIRVDSRLIKIGHDVKTHFRIII